MMTIIQYLITTTVNEWKSSCCYTDDIYDNLSEQTSEDFKI
ncbi:hypothetical protein HMPREF9372_2897 [Sporosarcina newyorkensis 2681]|uniref:Uncharacterized protein n=1 Tax=Sporosarcina newyorkensis 2681 TaxID=1027292 RepID=F9DVR6_9BACL|nr:hypothetical protein HMPREF9372_2897 [Sporosarcina newyorkensis 2681]